MRKPYFDNPEVEKKAAAVYKDGFNIYMYDGRLRKQLKRSGPFPDAVMLRFFDAYWKNKPGVQKPYPYFIKTFQMVSADYFANQQIAQHQKYKEERAPVAQNVKDILKGMFA